MGLATDRAETAPPRPDGASRPRKALTIGAVCKILSQEFDEISISKIRYLEDQKLLTPRRTRGGYRLYSQADVERLRTILRMQRDEFLPLRVIRQELAAGHDRDEGERRSVGPMRRAVTVDLHPARFVAEELIEQTGASEELLAELEEYGIVQPERRDGKVVYDDTDLEIVRAAAELGRYGVAGRNLRLFRTSADREAALLQQLFGPALRSNSQARRKEAVESLESLAAVCTNLQHLLLVRDLRKLTG
ncbi:MAG TPA: MerR family transcriptional regulator [Solirubrobacterales bacterium]|nr:MerR family transcriptional regulator [Solirubrobacterales bacterium]